MEQITGNNRYFLEFTTNGIPVVLSFIAIFSISQTPTGEAVVNGSPVDQKFSDVISTLDSIGVIRVTTKGV